MKVVDLSLPLMDGGGFGMPAKIAYFDHRARGKAMAERLGVDPADFGGVANAFEEISYLNCHTATHFDAPWHYTDMVDGKRAMTIDEVPLERCFGPGVWLDLSHKKPADDITAEDIKKAVAAINYTIKPGDIVLIKTGASAYYSQPGCDNMNAGMTREATLWLADQGVNLVGNDAMCWDRPPQIQMEELRKKERPGLYMQGHRAAGERNMCILEWLNNLDLLPHYGFTVYAFPIKVAKGSGAWVRVVAMFEE